MILTGKAKEDFYNFCKNKGLENFHNKSYALEVCKTFWKALIIEWLDSVGIYIQPKRFTHCLEFQDWYFMITDKKGIHLNNFLENRIKIDSRQQATEQAIIKANEIYNER